MIYPADLRMPKWFLTEEAKSLIDAVENNCSKYDKDLEPTERAANRERVDQFLARFFDGYKPWTPWRACSVN
ncbi:hypothetical protein COO92_12335 [Thalassospira lohafexi]|uniref:Uncharacterized protein n=2 Tax=Thalassospira lohafexi TaxID=744227 RepID=A0A2N3L6T7_9PROT|nr:hypothetical protein COO92_12335 [Thalassospira lohafexi]